MPESPVIIQIMGFVLLSISIVYIWNNKFLLFRNELLFFICTFVFSAFSSYFLYGQDFYLSLKGSMPFAFALGLYVLANKFDLSPNFIFKVLLGFSFVFICIEIIEQFTYPDYLFCGRIEKDNRELEIRMGLWRMYVFGINYCLLVYTIILQRIFDGEKIVRNIFLLFFLFVGIVVFTARKDIFAALSIILIGYFISTQMQQTTSTRTILLFLIAAAFLVLPDLMSELNEQSRNEITDENFIRYMAAGYFMYEMNTSPAYYLFGAGIPTGDSPLAMHIKKLSESFGFYQADCGFVGYISMLGVVGLLPYILIISKIIRNFKYVDLSLILFGIMMLELSFFDFFGFSTRNVAATMIYLYLVEISIEENIQNYELTCDTYENTDCFQDPDPSC